MNTYALVAGIVSLVLCGVLSGYSWRSPELRLTVRRQFDDWHDLLELFRGGKDVSAHGGPGAFKDKALHAAWCNHTLPPHTTRAPFCTCVEKAAVSYANASSTVDDSVMKLVSCMGNRTPWRVKELWAVRYTTPAVYVLFICTCFLIVGADLSSRLVNVGLWTLCAVFIIILVVSDFVHNSFWGFTFFVVVLLINWVLVPGMTSVNDGESGNIKRIPSCFWWSEYLSTPIFALYIPLMHCGRDLVFAGVFTMIGTAVGGLGLRSFWCGEVYAESPANQFQSVMQRIVWLGILASSISLAVFTAIYYQSDVPYVMGRASVALFALTSAVSLLQWPGNQNYRYLLETQILLAAARNIALFAVVLVDASSS